MSSEVWKFDLPLGGVGTPFVELPQGAKILSVGTQDGQTKLWALVDPDQKEFERRQLFVLGTGWRVMDAPGGRFIGTVTDVDGWMVFHVWEAAL